MKLGDIFVCCNEEDLRKTMQDLSYAGFHAVRAGGRNFNIRITGVQETQYLVQARSEGGSVQRAYCDTLEEAGGIAAEYARSFQWVEILKGYRGEWETVSQSW